MTWNPGRARGSVLAASLVGGSADVLDFLLPLWAGLELGATPAQIGALVAVELLLSLVARPLAGWLSDTRERTRVAAVGALVYGASCLGYALAPGLGLAFTSAVAGGVGGAFLWVAVRAITAERIAGDGGAFAGLFSAVAFASWFFWVPALVLLPAVGYRGVFTGLGVACFLGAAALLRAPGREHVPSAGPTTTRSEVRRLAPLLMVVALTSAAEAGVGLMLLLHLQRGFDLEVHEIALVFLPGGLAMTLLPRFLHRLTVRHGRRSVYAAASLGSAGFAASLALAPVPLVVAGLWILTSTAWAAIVPIHEAAVAHLSGDRPGRGMSMLSSAGLLGGVVGSASAGVLYGASSWQVACGVFACLLAAGAVAGPLALVRVGLPDRAPIDVDATPPVLEEEDEGRR